MAASHAGSVSVSASSSASSAGSASSSTASSDSSVGAVYFASAAASYFFRNSARASSFGSSRFGSAFGSVDSLVLLMVISSIGLQILDPTHGVVGPTMLFAAEDRSAVAVVRGRHPRLSVPLHRLSNLFGLVRERIRRGGPDPVPT